MSTEPRLYASYPLINFWARTDEEAALLIQRAERCLNALGDERQGESVDAVLGDEVYAYGEDPGCYGGTKDPEPWHPSDHLPKGQGGSGDAQ